MTNRPRLLILLLGFAVLTTGPGCSRRIVRLPAAPANYKTDDSYVDLTPDWKLRVVIPLLNSGGFIPPIKTQRTEGNTITLSSKDLVGYQVSHYAIKDKGRTGVRIEFVSAEATREGNTIVEVRPPSLPFSLPRRSGHIRLVYLVRASSQADHNMAIVAARQVDALNAFTRRLQQNPDLCSEKQGIFCSWVPAGVAVRPEKR